jgi:hypothetical protein
MLLELRREIRRGIEDGGRGSLVCRHFCHRKRS